MTTADDAILRRLIAGDAGEDEVRDLIRRKETDPGRLRKYNAILQEMVPWDDQILLRISEHLYIVARSGGERIVKCDCGEEFGDYRVNWKLQSVVHIRDTREKLLEVFNGGVMPHPDKFEVREFYCPNCAAQLGTEISPPGYPIQMEFLPDIDTLYADWLGEPLEDSNSEWYQDLSSNTTMEWSEHVAG